MEENPPMSVEGFKELGDRMLAEWEQDATPGDTLARLQLPAEPFYKILAAVEGASLSDKVRHDPIARRAYRAGNCMLVGLMLGIQLERARHV